MTNLLDTLHFELFEALGVGLAINDMDGKLLYVNTAYSELIGYSKEEIEKLSYWDITPLKYAEQEEIQLESLKATSSYGPYDKEYTHKNGSLIPVRLNGRIIEIDGKKYIWSSVEDITFSKSKEVSISLEQSAALIEKSVNEVFIFGYTDLCFLYANEIGCKNIGYELNDLLKMTLMDLSDEFKEASFKSLLVSLVNESAEKVEAHAILKRKDGSTYHSEIKLQIGNYKGQACYIAYVSDVTDRVNIEAKKEEALEELDKALHFQQVIQQSAAYALIGTTVDGIITNFNFAAEELLGYTAEELIGKESPARFHDISEVLERSKAYGKILKREIKPGFDTFRCLSDAGIKNEDEWTYISKNGKRIPVLISITALKNSRDETTGYLGIASDITDRKLKEQELKEAKKSAERALDIKNSFLANISHELRTPMNGILGMTSILMEEIEEDNHVENLSVIKESALSLLDILNDILDLSKIESGNFQVDPTSFNLKSIIIHTIKVYKASLQEKRIKLSYNYDENIPEMIFADELRIKQIINNLLNNAVKFTERGEVKLSAQFENNNIVIAVEDTGIGISNEEQDNIFLNFTQADSSTTRKYGGTGLGLTITKSLVERMGGSIWVKSKVDIGSTFTFKIPVEISTTNEIPKDEFKLITFEELPISILVVEDNVINQKIICGLLSKLGFEAKIASHGKEALETLLIDKFDLVFMDCHMPIMDGFETTRRIVSTYKEKRPYIVAVSASAMDDDVENCYKAGMDFFISKPISTKALCGAMQKYKSTLK